MTIEGSSRRYRVSSGGINKIINVVLGIAFGLGCGGNCDVEGLEDEDVSVVGWDEGIISCEIL